MSVNGIATSDGLSSTYGAGSSYDSSISNVGYDDFLTLLVAEMENQNPLEPLESSEFTSQLAGFATVEQLYAMSDSLNSINEAINAQGEQEIMGLIGHSIVADDNSILVENNEVRSGYYQLEETADVYVNIYDQGGSLVRSLFFEDQTAGEHLVDWDGRNTAGETAENGTYRFSVIAKTANGASVDVNTYITGEVTGITYEYGEPYLMLGDRLISADQTIVQVNKTAQPEA